MSFLDIKRAVFCTLASKYGLNGDKKEFKNYFGLFEKAQDYEKEHRDAAAAAVKQSIAAIKIICDEVPKGEGRFSTTVHPKPVQNPLEGMPDRLTGVVGLGVVKRLPAAGRYVVFSDHHLIDRSNRQNFFGSENKELYLDILKDYYAVGDFDLVENGDVEELLIYEPDLSEMEGIGSWSWQEILAYRRSKIAENIRLIAKDNRDYYKVLYENFASKRKYHKIVGNHDVALMDRGLMQVLRDETGYNFAGPVETVILSDDDRHRYFICHGHQFDHSCTAGLAEFVGESLSQAGAWAFQGPDRTWLHKRDWLDDMLEGKRPVFNNVVGSEWTGMTTGHFAALTAAAAAGTLLGGGGAAGVAAALAGGALSVTAMQAIFNIVPPKNFFEQAMEKNIAWEYFEDPNNTTKLCNQILSGKRWFKIRHTEETELTDFLANETPVYNGVNIQFPWTDQPPPTVVIGHTHEPRFKAKRQFGKTAHHYINSAAAGRFENLIWGVEIVDEGASLVSWHRDACGAPVRTLWKPDSVDPGNQIGILRPAENARLEDLLENFSSETPQEEEEETLSEQTSFRIAVGQ